MCPMRENYTAAPIPDRAQWRIDGNSRGYTIQNRATGYYLCAAESGNNPSAVTMSAAEQGDRTLWRIKHMASYIELTACNFKSLEVDIGESQSFFMNSVANMATWSSTTDFIYSTTSPNISIDNQNQTVTGVSGSTQKETVFATHKVTGRTYSIDVKINKNAIIIIPGFMGSELLNVQNEKVWLDVDLNNLDNLSSSTALNIVGGLTYLECGYYGIPKENITASSYKYGTLDTYKYLYDNVSLRYSTEYEDIIFFAYDWRLSNDVAALALDELISDNGYDKVTIIAHSMGGLVASSYLTNRNSNSSIIENLIFLGTPFEGSIDMVELMINRDIAGYVSNSLNLGWYEVLIEIFDPIGNLVADFPSVYQLMPTQRYIEDYNQKYLTINTSVVHDEVCQTYFATDYYLSENIPDFNSYLMTKAEDFHESLYIDNEHISSTVNSYYIVGTGINTKVGLNYNTFNAIITRSTAGDGVVPVWSANLNGQYANKTYYALNTNHTGLVQSNNVFNMICNIIDNVDVLPPGITQTYTP